MYEKVLVPLDGSKLAESVLHEVRRLARGNVVRRVVLLTIVDIPPWSIEDSYDSAAISISLNNVLVQRAKEYLTKLRSRLLAEGMDVSVEVIEGRTARSIIEYAQKEHVSLIIIAAHGKTGIQRVMFGSTALRVLHDARVPVLLVRPESESG